VSDEDKAGVLEDVRIAWGWGQQQLEKNAKTDEALGDLVIKASDAFAMGLSYPALVEGLPEEGLEAGALGNRSVRNRLLALIYLACESCGYPRVGGSASGETPPEYTKTYGVFIKNLVVLRQSGVGYAQLEAELATNDLSEIEADMQKKGVSPQLNGVEIPDGLADVAKLVLLTFDIVINKGR